MEHRIQLLGSQQSFSTQPGETVLAAAERCGVHIPHECQFGGCGTCRIKLLQGSVRYEDFPSALSPEEAAEGFALACQAIPEGDLVVEASRRLPPCSPPAHHVVTVSSLTRLGHDVLHLVLDLPPKADLLWRAGQYVNVTLPEGGVRSFSLASRPQSGQIDLHIRQIPQGRFTQALAPQLRVGDTLSLELPLGNFCYHAEDYRPLVMVATGTGLAPIKSMLETLMDTEDCPPVSLYWGGRTLADLYLHDEIAAWAHRLCDFQFVPVLSRADAAWTGRRGHVQQAVLEDLGDLSEHAIYLCGSPRMVADAKRDFLAHGASVDHLYADSFTFQSRQP